MKSVGLARLCATLAWLVVAVHCRLRPRLARAGAPSRVAQPRTLVAAVATDEPLPPLRVAIAGGGVGGLCTALCLLKKGFDVTVYERTDAFKRFGGPIQLASNALSTFHAIDEPLFHRVMEQFTYTGTRACGIKDGLRAKGFSMGGDSLSYLWDPSVGADWYVRFPLKACADFWNLPYTGVIDRPDLQEVLLSACRALKPDFMRNGEEVVGYAQCESEPGVTLKLASGATASADMLVGSDGIWSSVRAQMYNEQKGELKRGGKERQGCTYSGYTVFAGETVLPLPDYYECGYKVYIGPKRYFVTSDVGNGRVQWYAFFATEPGMKRARSGWGKEGGAAPTAVAPSDAPASSVLAYLKGLHAGWSDEVHTVLDATPEAAVEQRDLYDRRPELFRSWSDGAVTLLGDAVHPMMPNLGQGGCQAIEDAYVLAEILEAALQPAVLEASAEAAQGGTARAVRGAAVRGALQRYYKARIARASTVQVLSRLASDLIINLFDTPWSPHDDKGRDWKSYLTFFWKPVLQYLVFPAQFAFLYAFAPSGRMGALPAQLEASWQERHRVGAEAAFARAREGGSADLVGAKGSFISD